MTEIVADGVTYGIWEDEDGEGILNSTLEVIQTEPLDTLTYICVAENIAGTDRALAQLTVHGMYMCVHSPEVQTTVSFLYLLPYSCACDHLPNWQFPIPSERDLSSYV